MYFFGDTSNNAQLLVEDIASWSGPGLPAETEWKKMGMEDTRSVMIYRSAALRDAVMEGQDQEIIDELCDMYEEALDAFCRHSNVLHRAVRLGAHHFPYPEQEAISRQRAIMQRHHGDISLFKRTLIEDMVGSPPESDVLES